MNSLVVLSPHRDDAAFSLFHLLTWLRIYRHVQVEVTNFFTVSAYAPLIETTDPAGTSAIRCREDREVLSSINPTLYIKNFEMLDAPLRLGISFREVCQQDPDAMLPRTLIVQLGSAMRKTTNHLTIAPLGLGNHIDHLAVLRAAVDQIPAHKLAFYEDLPYATWTEPRSLLGRVDEVIRATKTRLKRCRLIASASHKVKESAITGYRSQITAAEGAAIAKWGERIWIPAHSRPWLRLLNSLPKAFGKGPVVVDPHRP